jgi:hypothetical protein
LSIEVSTIIGAALWEPHYAFGHGNYSYSASAKSPNPGRDTSLDGTTNGSARVNSAPDMGAGINSATHLGKQRCGDHEDHGHSTNYRKLAEHKIATCPLSLQ